jgi:hypothetical protein
MQEAEQERAKSVASSRKASFAAHEDSLRAYLVDQQPPAKSGTSPAAAARDGLIKASRGSPNS